MSIFHIAFCLITPAVSIWAANRFKFFKVLGPVVLSYAAGIIVANIPGVHLDETLGTNIAGGAVLAAIPMLLFSTDLKKWVSLARGLLVSFACACFAAVVAAGAVGWAFRGWTDEWWKIAGMLVGVYVGGTANMSAIGFALETNQETFVILNAADVICGAAYLFFLLSVAQKVALKFLRPFEGGSPLPRGEGQGEGADPLLAAGEEPPSKWARKHIKPMAISFALTVAMAGASVGLSLGILGKLHIGFVMLGVTTFGIGASLFKRVRDLDGSFELGEYALLIFCAATGSLADASRVTGTSAILLAFVFIVMVSAAVIHFALCWLFKIDADTAIISSTATIFGPPFIGPVAAALKNRALVGPGLTLGLAGIALGTYLGLATAWALKAIA
ncbi:MAG: DUF819 family protein [Archangium sp.]|nr:DUF819 family protein [Archangium sp.]